MGDWERGWGRKPKGRGRGGGRRQSGCKPPSPESWKPMVPSWEKEFCYRIGSVPWKKLCESKPLMPYYKSVVEWDDSACEVAFHDAKARFWLHINSLPCDIPLPDRDEYIDEINWDAELDPGLLLDLDKNYSPPPQDRKFSYLVTGWDSFRADTSSTQNGWDFAEDGCHPVTTGWGDCEPYYNDEDIGANNYWDANAGCGGRVGEDISWRDNNISHGQRASNVNTINCASQWHLNNSGNDPHGCYGEPRRWDNKRTRSRGRWYGQQQSQAKR